MDLSPVRLGRAPKLDDNMGYFWVLFQIPPEIFSLWWSCSHHTVSGASTSPAISFHHWCSQLLHQSVAAMTLCNGKCWFGPQQQQLLCLESPGHPLPGALQAGRLLTTPTDSHLCAHQFTHVLTHSALDFWADQSVARLQDRFGSGSKRTEPPAAILGLESTFLIWF